MVGSSTKKGGMGVLSVLGIVFIVLKLVGTISWSWWWVLAPFWAMPAIGLVVVLATGFFAIIAAKFLSK